MKIKYLFLVVIFLGCITISFTSCSEGDEMRQGTVDDGGAPDSVRSTKSLSTTEANDTITTSDFTKD
ncbi:hypothetical protein CLV62_12170 [Dysgonomonas alginatilytica]|uniref:Uncharacterized protein n=1 Tax=Dysgonomonas alginatilytica TaxID=1605892 RepID=A0A2V3PL26_9BACT|nr:hypothetical protein [Dysgonomonas alginatilytica]PXV62247.1 hypothetical protein CLV62_12170 [Dysgonomonas alginatilytica]